MITLLEDMKMDEASEKVAVELAAHGVIGKRVDEMEPGFMMALDYMIGLAERDNDDQRKSLLKVIKETIPAANLNEIANQADDSLETMETRPIVPDRKLQSRLVLIREEARNMIGGGILDERNDRGFRTLSSLL